MFLEQKVEPLKIMSLNKSTPPYQSPAGGNPRKTQEQSWYFVASVARRYGFRAFIEPLNYPSSLMKWDQ